MERRIKSTASQSKKLMDQHVGTGFIIWKSSETTTTESEFFWKDGVPHNQFTGKPITSEFGACGLMKAQS
jgi:hypothetical protein